MNMTAANHVDHKDSDMFLVAVVSIMLQLLLHVSIPGTDKVI